MFAKITISVLFVVLIAGAAEAGFAKNIPSGRGESVIQTSDGGFLVTGTLINPDSEIIDSFIYKLNRFGNQVFRIRLKGTPNSTGTTTLILHKVIEVNDGYIVAGASADNKIVLVKVNIVGNILWIKSISETAFQFQGSLAPTTDGGFVLSGNFAPNATSNYLLGIKFNSAGEIVWRKRYNFRANSSSVLQTDDGGFLIGAGPNGTETNTTKFALLRLNSNGGIRWKKVLTINGANTFGQVIRIREGGFAMVANNNDRIHVMRFNANGGTVWSKFYGEELGSKSGITQVADGGLVVGGDDEKGLVFKLDPVGNIVWTLGFGKSESTLKNLSISPTLDGGTVTTGWMLVGGVDNAFIVKIDPSGVTATCGSFSNPVLPVAVSRFNIGTKPVPIQPVNVEVVDDGTIQISTPVPKVKHLCP